MADRPSERELARNKVQVNPSPADLALFTFLDKLFGMDDKPEKIELRQAFGPGLRKYGRALTQKEWKPSAPKATREQLVAIANEFIDLAQNDCNAIGKRHGYVVAAKHYAKADIFYATYPFVRMPTQSAAEDYDPNDPNHDADVPPDIVRRDQLIQDVLAHVRENDEHERFRQDQHAKSMQDLIANYQTLAQQLMQMDIEKNRLISEQLKENRDLFKVAQEAMSQEAERQLAIEKQKFHMALAGDALQFLKAVVPLAITHRQQSQLTNGQPQPDGPSAEGVAIRAFLEGLTQQQGELLFGKLIEDADGPKLAPGGIFSVDQAAIFAGVGHKNMSPTALDQLIEGPLAITLEQLGKAQEVMTAQQYMPLIMLFKQRQNALDAQRAQKGE
jgi:hypothetical protein